MIQGITFNAPKNEWPQDKCHAKRCREAPQVVYRACDLWPSRDEFAPRDVLLCSKHHLIHKEAAGDAYTEPEPLATEPLVVSAKEEALVPAKEEDQAQALQAQAVEIEEALTAVLEYEMTNQGDIDFAKEELASTKGQLNELEAKRKAATQPLLKAKREIDGWFKPATTSLALLERAWKGKIKEGMAALETKRLALLAVAEKASKEGDMEAVQTAMIATSEATPDLAGVQLRDNWLYEVTDEAAVPREFMSPDLRKLREAVKAAKGDIVIPGVKIWNDPIVASRSS